MPKRQIWALLFTLIFVAFGGCLLLHARPLRNFSEENLIYGLIWLDAWGLSFVALIALVWTWVPRREYRTPLLLGILSFYGLVTVSIIFAGTHFPENGYWGDQKFRLAMLTKFVTFGLGGDFYYKDLPSFYPPLYYAVLSWWGRLTGAEPYTLFKTGYQLIWIVMPTLLYLMWRQVVSSSRALAIVMATLLIDAGFARLIMNAPYVFVGSSLFFPWWLRYIEQLGPAITKRWRHCLIGGVIGALLFSTYFYPFFILALVMLIRTASGKRWLLISPARPFRLLWAWGVLGVSAFISLPYWLPVMISILRFGGDRSRGEWFHIDSPGISFPFLSLDWAGIFFLIGIAYLIWRWRESVGRTLLHYLMALLIFVLIGSVLGGLDLPLNLSKAKELIWFLAGPAVGLGLAAVIRHGRKYRRFRVAAIVLTLLFCLVTVQGFNAFAREGTVARARSTGRPAWGAETPERAEMNGKVLLTAVEEYFVFHPVYAFIAANENYTHPASRFIQRYDLLDLLQRVDDPYLFALVLRHNQFDAVDYFQPEISDKGLGLIVSINNYPNRLSTQQLYYSQKLLGDTSLFRPTSAKGIYRIGEVAGRKTKVTGGFSSLGDSLKGYDNVLLLRSRLTEPGKELIDASMGVIPFPHRALLAWPEEHTFGNRICLVGSSVYRVRDSIHMLVTCRANRKTDRNLKMFVHVFPGDGSTQMRNFDIVPTPSTNQWLPGDIFTYDIALPDFGASATVSLGFFDEDGVIGKPFEGKLDISI